MTKPTTMTSPPSERWFVATLLSIEQVREVTASGPGARQSGGAFEGGGFGLGGAVAGMAIAGVLNALTTQTQIETVVSIVYDDGEVHVLSRTVTPDALERNLAEARTAIRQAQRALPVASAPPQATDVVARLAELAALRDQGVVNDVEFAALKAKLLA